MIRLKVNGTAKEYQGDPEMPLLWYLRDGLQLTGSKFGCGMGLCGACTVHINGEAQRSCLAPMQSLAGKEVVTIEGLSVNGDHPLQRLGKRRTFRSAATARAGRSCKPRAFENQAERSRHRRSHARQYLPLWNVSAHTRGH